MLILPHRLPVGNRARTATSVPKIKTRLRGELAKAQPMSADNFAESSSVLCHAETAETNDLQLSQVSRMFCAALLSLQYQSLRVCPKQKQALSFQGWGVAPKLRAKSLVAFIICLFLAARVWSQSLSITSETCGLDSTKTWSASHQLTFPTPFIGPVTASVIPYFNGVSFPFLARGCISSNFAKFTSSRAGLAKFALSNPNLQIGG